MAFLNKVWTLTKLNRRSRRIPGLVLVLCVIVLVYVLHTRAVYKERSDTEYDVAKWFKYPTSGCGGHFTGYGHQFVILESAEFKGNETFLIPCDGKVPSYYFTYDEESPLGSWLSRLQTHPVSRAVAMEKSVRLTPTFVYKRIEAHNIYHTLCEWFNVFMVSKLLNFEPGHVDILFLDDRPKALLDDTWATLFGTITRYTDLPPDVEFKTLIWNVVGYNSPLNYHYLKYVPYIDEFHNFFINAFGIEKTKQQLDCTQLHVTVIWRRDYMTHPERKNLTNGLVHRKFHNEKEILREIASVFVNSIIKTVILEDLTMKQQMDIVTRTDVLIGMHGAGMAHALFLPKHAVVLEFFPNYWGFLRHFKMFSKWRNVKYIGWQNQDLDNEFPDFYTRIPPEIVKEHALKARNMIC